MSPEGLWNRSAAWRWTLVLTCFASALVVLLGPWNRKPPVLPNLATFHPTTQTKTPSITSATQTSSSTINQANNGHDEAFSVAVSQSTASFPPGTELHIVGVYSGSLPPGQSEQPWWANCLKNKNNTADMHACHQKYASGHTERTVTVTISRSSSPKVIALLAYEPVKWKIIGAEASNVQKIIISGYHSQDVDGVGVETPIDLYSPASSSCRTCSRQFGHFYAYRKDTPEYDQAINMLKMITGLSPSTFQGTQSADRFTISGTSQVSRSVNNQVGAKHQSDPISGQNFVNQVAIAQTVIPLPDGQWQGVAYTQNPSNRGTDELGVLARIDQNKLIELAVFRIQFASDQNGFSRHSACLKQDVHQRIMEANEEFGSQICFWTSHDTDPWMQPIFNLTAARLTAKGINLPGFLLNSMYHKADKSSSLTVIYMANPETKGIVTPKTNWHTSPWHPQFLNQFPEKSAFLQDRLQWAKTWFQIFKATR